MPQWIDTPAGPQYVDDYGNPTAPPLDAPVAQPSQVQQVDPSIGPQAVAEPAVQGAQPFTPSQPSPAVPAVPAPVQAPVGPAIDQWNQATGQPPAPVPTNTASSVGTSQSAFSGDTFDAVGRTTGGLKAEQEAANAGAKVGAADERKWASALGGDQARAATNYGAAESEKHTAEAQSFREQARLGSMFAAAESAAADISAQQTSGYRARFEQQLAQASAMRIDPRLNFNTQDGIGAAALLFTQGFLQAQGTPVFDAQGMIDKLINRKVDRDMQAIAQGHKLAEGTRQLWDMARSEASDESEARGRYRALTMAQAASDMEATTAQFNSKLASAKGAAAAADIRVQVNKDLAAITDRYFNKAMQEKTLSLDQWKTQVQASHLSRSDQISEREIALKEKAAGAAVDPTANVVFDVTDSGERKAKWKWTGSASDAVKKDVGTRMAAKAALIDQTRELRNMAAEAGKVPGGWGKKMTNSAFSQRVEMLASGIAANYTRAMTGAQASDKEREDHRQRIPINRILMRDGDQVVREGLSDFIAEARTNVNAEVGQWTTDLTPSDPGYGTHGGSPTWAEGEGTEADILRNGGGEEKTKTQSAVEELRSPKNTGTIRPTALWRQVGNPINDVMRENPGREGVVEKDQEIPAWAPAMETIFKTAVEREKKWGSKGGEPSSDNVEAYRTLHKLKVEAKDPAQADYANDLLQLVDDTVKKSGQRSFSLTDLLD